MTAPGVANSDEGAAAAGLLRSLPTTPWWIPVTASPAILPVTASPAILCPFALFSVGAPLGRFRLVPEERHKVMTRGAGEESAQSAGTEGEGVFEWTFAIYDSDFIILIIHTSVGILLT